MIDLANSVNNYFKSELTKGNKILSFRASTKGKMSLRFSEIKKDMKSYITEINQVKIRLKTLGSEFELVFEIFIASLEPGTYFPLPDISKMN